jgi:rare lipoprotein A
VVQPPKTGYVTASWYGSKFHGRQTASGEIYNMYSMTCAHKKFPFGTRLRVTYLRTNKSAIVTVNDRGPFIPGRDLDLSYAAAKTIGLTEAGVGRVKMEYIGRDMSYVKRVSFGSSSPSTGPFIIQVGSFREKANADRLKEGLIIRYDSVYITTTYLNRQKYYRVRIGPFTDKARAYSFAKILAEEGYSIFITIKN